MRIYPLPRPPVSSSLTSFSTFVQRAKPVNSTDTFFTLKIGISHPTGHPNREADIYTHLQQSLPSSQHEGRAYVRTLHEAFELDGPDGKHWCLVHPPLGVSMREWQEMFPEKRYPVELLKVLVRSLLLALDCLHEEGGVIHTGTTIPFPSPFLASLIPSFPSSED